jgi:hypothetical protein
MSTMKTKLNFSRRIRPCAAWRWLVLLLIGGILMPIVTQAEPASSEAWPNSLTAQVGDLLVRIDGPKLWTLSRIEYKNTIMGVEDSAYGSVVTYPGAKHLGTAHFLDVPGKPGEVEKEHVTSLRFFLDGKPIAKTSDLMVVAGGNFRVERISKIRNLNVDSFLEVKDGAIVQSARYRTAEPIELQQSYPLMYAWCPSMTEFIFCGDDGKEKEGKFNTATTKPSEGLEKSARWLAVYDALNQKGAVAYLVEKPEKADAWFQYTDAPGIYRKLRIMSFVNATVPAGFDGTYCVVCGFFSALPDGWKPLARKRAGELAHVAEQIKSNKRALP